MALIADLGDKSDFGKKFTVAMEIIDSERRKGLLESVDYIDVSLPEQPVLFVSEFGTNGTLAGLLMINNIVTN